MHDLTIVIPTLDDDPLTAACLPDDVPVNVEIQGTLNEARNRGVWGAQTQFVAIMDDDLQFPPELLTRIRDRLDETTLIGIGDWDFGWLAGRVMAFDRALWDDLGGFDERLRSHMGDTDFALRAWRAGYDLERMPRELIYHEPHERSITAWDRIWRLGYMAVKHPRDVPRFINGVRP